MASKVYKTAATRLSVITHFRECGRVDLACQRAGVDRTAHYRWLKEHEDYRKAWEEAQPIAADLLMDEVVRRGLEGVPEPVFSGGKRAMDYVTGPDGKVRMEPCGCLVAPAVDVTTHSDAGPKAAPAAARKPDPLCKACKGGGIVPMMGPAVVRKYSDACLLAATSQRVPNFGAQKHRVVDEEGKDKPLTLDLVHAYCNSIPDDGETLP